LAFPDYLIQLLLLGFEVWSEIDERRLPLNLWLAVLVTERLAFSGIGD
jgi:hypothetical protein